MESHKIYVNRVLIFNGFAQKYSRLLYFWLCNLKYAHIFQEFEWAEEHCSNLDIHSNKLSRNCLLHAYR